MTRRLVRRPGRLATCPHQPGQGPRAGSLVKSRNGRAAPVHKLTAHLAERRTIGTGSTRPRDKNRPPRWAAARAEPPAKWLVMPIYPSGHGAAALAGAQSGASRPGRRAAAVRSRANGMGSYQGLGAKCAHPAPALHCPGRPDLSSEPALTGPGRRHRPAAALATPPHRAPRRNSSRASPPAPQPGSPPRPVIAQAAHPSRPGCQPPGSTSLGRMPSSQAQNGQRKSGQSQEPPHGLMGHYAI
jgi:hypothetical protein